MEILYFVFLNLLFNDFLNHSHAVSSIDVMQREDLRYTSIKVYTTITACMLGISADAEVTKAQASHLFLEFKLNITMMWLILHFKQSLNSYQIRLLKLDYTCFFKIFAKHDLIMQYFDSVWALHLNFEENSYSSLVAVVRAWAYTWEVPINYQSLKKHLWFHYIWFWS